MKFAKQEFTLDKNKSKKFVFIAVTGILMAFLIGFVCSHAALRCRLDDLEYRHCLLTDDDLLGKCIEEKENKQLLLQYKQKISELEAMKGLTNYQSEHFDRTGRADYALESAGAEILSIGNTKAVAPPFRYWSTLFGFSSVSDYAANRANRVIQPSSYPGECFAFAGRGEIIIKLIKSVYIDTISIEHISPQMSPEGNIQNAPRDFSVFGMVNENDAHGGHFGDFQYDINKNQPLQSFRLNAASASSSSYPIVRIEITSNHGDPNYTCVYRIRVHGSLTKNEN